MVLVLLVLAVGVPAEADSAADGRLVVRTDQTGQPLDADLVGFNWRDGGEVVTELSPTLVRMWAVDFSRITPDPGVYDWTLPDAHVDAIRTTGATPMIVLIGRPSWANSAGSAGYEAAVEEAVRRYGVERVPDGAPPAVFEAGNEPEFYPTAHGQFPWEMPLDVAAQARAIARVESESAATVTWGGPGALFADPPVLDAFARAAQSAGRPADFLSFHHYTNYPFLGPDGSERTDPAAASVHLALGHRNPTATPAIIGDSVTVARSIADHHPTPTGGTPEVYVSEWNLSAGGFDARHDTHEGAAHAIAALIEMHEHRADAAQFFAATDRHCAQPPEAPDALCGDWGTATADGIRKPVWFAFDLWQRLAGPTLTTVIRSEEAPVRDTWSIATRQGNRVTVMLASFSPTSPQQRTFQLEVPGAEATRLVVRTIAASNPAAEASVASQDPEQPISLPANAVVLVEFSLR